MLQMPEMVPIEVGEDKLVAYWFDQGDLPSSQISASRILGAIAFLMATVTHDALESSMYSLLCSDPNQKC